MFGHVIWTGMKVYSVIIPTFGDRNQYLEYCLMSSLQCIILSSDTMKIVRLNLSTNKLGQILKLIYFNFEKANS